MKTNHSVRTVVTALATALGLSGWVSFKSTKLPDSWTAALRNPPTVAGDVAGTCRAGGQQCAPSDLRKAYGGGKLEMVFFEHPEMSASARVTLKQTAADQLEVVVVDEGVSPRSAMFAVSVDSSTGALILERKNKSSKGVTESLPHAELTTAQAHLRKGRDGCLYVQTTVT